MGVITRMRKQTAVYWKRTGTDRYGKETYEDPVEIDCRWDTQYAAIESAVGEEMGAADAVYPDRLVYLGDLLWRGTIDEWDALGIDDPLLASPFPAKPVRNVQITPTFRNTENLYTVRL
jgi:hypothetical protein